MAPEDGAHGPLHSGTSALALPITLALKVGGGAGSGLGGPASKGASDCGPHAQHSIATATGTTAGMRTIDLISLSLSDGNGLGHPLRRVVPALRPARVLLRHPHRGKARVT